MKEKYGIVPGLFWIGLSIYAMIGSYPLGLGDFRDPGAGLMPFLIGALLFLTSLPLVLKSIVAVKKRISEKAESGKINFTKIVSVAVSLFLYCFFLQKLGYLAATTLLLLFLFKTASSRKWRFVIIASVLTSVVSYLGFTFLGLRFPRGILGI
ncbi:MAG TPA: tripartite tricarboxylate transporter TctB family protein [Thermodesulfobacteriota bacterium]|nr:tripartite tricarboxylate transporter TctB family protein [Thermodesulfobacteriota bacterium]